MFQTKGFHEFRSLEAGCANLRSVDPKESEIPAAFIIRVHPVHPIYSVVPSEKCKMKMLRIVFRPSSGAALHSTFERRPTELSTSKFSSWQQMSGDDDLVIWQKYFDKKVNIHFIHLLPFSVILMSDTGWIWELPVSTMRRDDCCHLTISDNLLTRNSDIWAMYNLSDTIQCHMSDRARNYKCSG